MSHDTIYRSLFVQARGVLKKELLSHLRSKRSMRRSKPVDPNGDRRGHIKDIASIRQRPATIEDRAVPGHWKGDLLSGPDNSYIATSRWPSGTARRYFIEITLEKHDDKVLEPLRPRARQHPQVLKAHTVTGD